MSVFTHTFEFAFSSDFTQLCLNNFQKNSPYFGVIWFCLTYPSQLPVQGKAIRTSGSPSGSWTMRVPEQPQPQPRCTGVVGLRSCSPPRSAVSVGWCFVKTLYITVSMTSSRWICVRPLWHPWTCAAWGERRCWPWGKGVAHLSSSAD